MVQDFGKNRKAAYTAEIKSAHFGKQQVTVHPVVAFYRTGDTIIRDSLIFLSDDITHDHQAVQEFTRLSLELLRKKLTIKKLTIWSDGAASQYKVIIVIILSFDIDFQYQNTVQVNKKTVLSFDLFCREEAASMTSHSCPISPKGATMARNTERGSRMERPAF